MEIKPQPFEESAKSAVPNDRLVKLANLAVMGGLLIVGLWWVVMLPLGPGLSQIPGDLGDVRFNNYTLEHFFRWASGLEKSYWTAPFFYPFSLTIAFSDNLLGSAPFYAGLRWAGLDRETAYQGWTILGYTLNYLAAVVVLSRLKLSALAVSAGAFYFAFGLPILAQENHPQLLYRFAVPIAGYALWRFAQTPRLRTLVGLAAAVTLQFYLAIYTGIFVLMLLAAMALALPFCLPKLSFTARILFWPRQFRQAWLAESGKARLFSLAALACLIAALIGLLLPYWQVSKVYSFVRTWDGIVTMLPRWKSYLLTDGSTLWRSISATITAIPMRPEHQLFPGIAVIIALTILFLLAKTLPEETRTLVGLHLCAVGMLVLLTLYVNGRSPYKLIASLPGISSIRAVSRIILVMMYPLALVIAFSMDRLLDKKQLPRLIGAPIALIIFALLLAESMTYRHVTFAKADAQAHVARLLSQAPGRIESGQFLLFNQQPNQPEWTSEIDAMIAGQELDSPVINGYSGNFPPGYAAADSCAKLPWRLIVYMNFSHISDNQFYLDSMQRALPIGFDDCNPDWWQKKPGYTRSAGPIPAQAFSQLEITTERLTLSASGARVRVSLTNHAQAAIPARSSTQNPIYLSWRWVKLAPSEPASDFTTRKQLDFDIQPGEPTFQVLGVALPKTAGLYQLQVTAVQEGVAWFTGSHAIASTKQLINVDANHQTVLFNETPTP
jgi:hypothetical protein